MRHDLESLATTARRDKAVAAQLMEERERRAGITKAASSTNAAPSSRRGDDWLARSQRYLDNITSWKGKLEL